MSRPRDIFKWGRSGGGDGSVRDFHRFEFKPGLQNVETIGELRALLADVDRLDIPDDARVDMSAFHYDHEVAVIVWDRDVEETTLDG